MAMMVVSGMVLALWPAGHAAAAPHAPRIGHGLARRIGNMVTSSGALHAHRHRAPPRPAAKPRQAASAAEATSDAAAKNRPLVEDIRLLGRILGDVIREQEGKDAFELIERVRQLSVAYRLKQRRQRRARARPAAEEPVGRPDGERDPRLQLLLAPGQHRRRPPPRAPPRCTTSAQGHQQEGSLALTLRAAAPRRHPRRRHRRARCSTPTSRRCSPPTPPRCSARASSTPSAPSPSWWASATTCAARASARDNEALIRARVTQLWQTRMLRTAKLTVADEIENALSYYHATFLRQIPRLYREIEERAARPRGARRFLRMGNWIGGDRDGNPNVSADTLRMALARQAEMALRFYLTEVHELGAELSMSRMLAPVTRRDAGAGRRARPTTTRTASDEPYRRALIGMYARLAATLHALTGTEALRHAVAPQKPYAERGRVPGRPARHRALAAAAPRAGADRRRAWRR